MKMKIIFGIIIYIQIVIANAGFLNANLRNSFNLSFTCGDPYNGKKHLANAIGFSTIPVFLGGNSIYNRFLLLWLDFGKWNLL